MENLVFPLSEKEAKDKGIKRNSSDNRNAMFPSRLRELRATQKSPDGKAISQQMLADIEDIGITKSTISLYETGENIPDAKRIVMLANYFGVSTDYLLCQNNVKTPNVDVQEISTQTKLSEKSILYLQKEFWWNVDIISMIIENETTENKIFREIKDILDIADEIADQEVYKIPPYYNNDLQSIENKEYEEKRAENVRFLDEAIYIELKIFKLQVAFADFVKRISNFKEIDDKKTIIDNMLRENRRKNSPSYMKEAMKNNAECNKESQ